MPAPDGDGGTDGESRGTGVVTAFEPPHRLAFTWAHEAGAETEATFELAPADGGTALVVTHRRLDTTGLVLGVSAGWHSHFAILAAKLADDEPPPFWATFLRMRDVYRRHHGL